jgi:hypothetical protein
MPKRRTARWDVFVAHAGPDLPSAKSLSDALADRHRLRCYLDADRLRGGDSWPVLLKRALADSRVIAVLISEHSDRAFYLQEEVAIAITLLRSQPEATRVVPVLLSGARQSHLPYGTFGLHSLREEDGGLPLVADALAAIITQLPVRSPGRALAHSSRLVDSLWAGMEPALTDKCRRVPEEYRVRFAADGDDLVAIRRDVGEAQRVTRAQLARRLSADQLHHVEVLERSMEINRAIWDERYPNRVLDKRSRRAANEAAAALAEDLTGVLSTIESAGLWLDDHYVDVRQIAADHASAR